MTCFQALQQVPWTPPARLYNWIFNAFLQDFTALEQKVATVKYAARTSLSRFERVE